MYGYRLYSPRRWQLDLLNISESTSPFNMAAWLHIVAGKVWLSVLFGQGKMRQKRGLQRSDKKNGLRWTRWECYDARWMCGVTRKDKIKNEHIWGTTRVAQASKQITQRRLNWFWHVMRKSLAVTYWEKCWGWIYKENVRQKTEKHDGKTRANETWKENAGILAIHFNFIKTKLKLIVLPKGGNGSCSTDFKCNYLHRYYFYARNKTAINHLSWGIYRLEEPVFLTDHPMIITT